MFGAVAGGGYGGVEAGGRRLVTVTIAEYSRASDDLAGCQGACAGAEVLCFEAEGTKQQVEYAYVGPGQGGFTQAAIYTYVGDSKGSYDEMLGDQPYGWQVRPMCLGLVVLVVFLVAVVFLVVPAVMTSTTRLDVSRLPLRECLVWGDPHIHTFDGSELAVFGEGINWLVKSDQVHIQARYRATPFTSGLAALDAIAIGGPFMRGHVLRVGAMETGDINFDGRPICSGLPSTFSLMDGGDRLGNVSHGDQGMLMDNAMSHLPKSIVLVDLPLRLHLQIMRWSHHVNVRITMPALPQQDGDCGNANGLAGNDMPAAIRSRAGPARPSESLFIHYLPHRPGPQLTLQDCPPERRSAAEARCRRGRPGIAGAALHGCVFDVCFAGPQYATQGTMY